MRARKKFKKYILIHSIKKLRLEVIEINFPIL